MYQLTLRVLCLTPKNRTIMKLRFSLYIELQYTEFEVDTDELDRNYDDEDYGYWLIEDKFGYIHETNIRKDEDGNFLMEGVDYVWFDEGDFEDSTDADVVEDITFTKI